jgi:hypothetical protein
MVVLTLCYLLVCVVGVLFDPEIGGSTLLQNVSNFVYQTTWHHTLYDNFAPAQSV